MFWAVDLASSNSFCTLSCMSCSFEAHAAPLATPLLLNPTNPKPETPDSKPLKCPETPNNQPTANRGVQPPEENAKRTMPVALGP